MAADLFIETMTQINAERTRSMNSIREISTSSMFNARQKEQLLRRVVEILDEMKHATERML